MQGIWTALVTPFQKSDEIDEKSFRNILKDQLQAGVAGVVVCGTTGESPTLSLDEKKRLIQITLEELKGSEVRIAAGTGNYNTQETLHFSKWADQQGVDAVLLVTPYYNKPSATGLQQHFLKIAQAIRCEVILYNVPGRTMISLSPETVMQLARVPNIRTLKEASGAMSLTNEILQRSKEQSLPIDILSGDDATFLPLLSIGAVGAISVASNLFPRALVQMQKAMMQGNPKEALGLHQQFYPLFRDLFIETNPVPIKQALSYLGWCQPTVRLPLTPLSSAHADQLYQSMIRCGFHLNGSQGQTL